MGIRTWNRYTIMHKDRKIACIHRSGLCDIYNSEFMPYNLYLEEVQGQDIDTQIMNLENFYYWCSSRILTLDRKYAKEILNSLGKKQAATDRDRAEIAISYHCLSLLDVYWVMGEDENVSFDEINLYNHSLTDAFVDVCLHGKTMTIQNSELLDPSDVIGNVGTPGVAPKAWVRRNGEFYLYKDGDERDVEAELLSSKILECFRIEHVKYVPDFYDGKKVSSSKIITSLDRSIVPAEYVGIYAVNNDTDLHSIVYELSWYSYHMMIIMDYLIGNTDRHWANWGFYVDNHTNKLIGLYPLMDFNKAFTGYGAMNGGLCLPAGGTITQQEAARMAVKSVGLNQIHEVDEEWFSDKADWEMFQARLEYLKTC